MKEGLLEKIEKVGHWRVNFRPAIPLSQTLSFEQCLKFVHDNAVSIRGWDYPHISNRQDDEGGYSRGDTFYENWCEWWGFYEFWRMYKSGQFLSYNALREDTKEEGRHGTLGIINTIYTVTEFIEFAHRLYSSGLYKGGLNISIELRNTKGRFLDVGPSRMPFFDRKESSAETIKLEKTVSVAQMNDAYQSVAIDLLLELFDYFGWNPSREQIASDQARFYRRDFS
jgi:hypothetical protein